MTSGGVIIGVPVEKVEGLKDVVFAEGQLRFRIPAAWIDGHESDGSGAFYDQELDRGTLRVKLMTFTSPDDLTGHKALEQLSALEEEPGQKLEALPNGNALRLHHERADASGEPTMLHVWLLAGIDPPHRMRLAVFSFVVLAKDAGTAGVRKLVATLDREIRAATFAHQMS